MSTIENDSNALGETNASAPRSSPHFTASSTAPAMTMSGCSGGWLATGPANTSRSGPPRRSLYRAKHSARSRAPFPSSTRPRQSRYGRSSRPSASRAALGRRRRPRRRRVPRPPPVSMRSRIAARRVAARVRSSTRDRRRRRTPRGRSAAAASARRGRRDGAPRARPRAASPRPSGGTGTGERRSTSASEWAIASISAGAIGPCLSIHARCSASVTRRPRRTTRSVAASKSADRRPSTGNRCTRTPSMSVVPLG